MAVGCGLSTAMAGCGRVTDIRDGERLPNLRGKEAYRQPDGQIALWDGERYVLIGPNREGLRIALQQMKLARDYAEGRS